ncbi:MAG: hypothetical protein ACXAC7_18790, partial [Candidatus Hodarchaeales archaeon]
MKKNLMLYGFLVIGFVFTQGFIVASAQMNVGPRSVRMVPPRANEPIVNYLRNGLIPIIFGMKDANFSSGDVLYTEFTIEDSYKRPIPIERFNSTTTFDVTSFKAKLNDFLTANASHPLANTTLLQNVQNELANIDSIDINRYQYVNAMKKVNLKTHFVVILWDNDTSVIDAIEQIQSNESLSKQPFSGDEVFTIVQMKKETENVFGTFTESTQWKYENGSNVRSFRYLIELLSKDPVRARNFVQTLELEEEIDLLRSFIGFNNANVVFTENQARKNTHLGFSVSQLQIKDLDLVRKPNGNMGVSKLNYVYVEHQSLGWTIFNDTNANGIMDLGMKTISSNRPGLNGTVIPTRSNESLYRVDFQDAETSVYSPVTKTDSDLTFSLSASNVNVQLNPIMSDRDSTLFTDSYSVGGPQTIDSTGFVFHYYPNATSGRAVIKFDYEIGNWSNQSLLEGLSLNHMFVTTIRNFDATNKVLKLQANETDLDNEADARHTRKLRFQVGQSPIADVELDEIPYEWAGTEEIDALG